MTKYLTLVLALFLSVSMVTHAMMDFICYYGFFIALKIGNFKVTLESKNALSFFLKISLSIFWFYLN